MGIVDDRHFQRGSSYRLVYCDVVKGDPALPEQRPLIPHQLFKVVATSTSSQAEVAALRPPDDWNAQKWARIGSTVPTGTVATPFWNEATVTSRPSRGQSNSASTSGAVWHVYYQDGTPFYHNAE